MEILKKNNSSLFLSYFLFFIFLIYGCGTSKKKQEKQTVVPKKNFVDIISSPKKQLYTIGDSINFTIKIKPDSIYLDSLHLFVNEHLIKTLPSGVNTFILKTDTLSVGYQYIKTVSFYEDSAKESDQLTFRLLSDIIPVHYSCKIINTYPHDPSAYTQGLTYENGFLYEGTGLNGHSSLRKVDIKTGKILQTYTLKNEYFGEGIAIFHDKIIQITYKSQTAFIYNKENFQRITSFYYPNREGWGITYDGKHLIMSDGSHKLFYYDKNNFKQVKFIEVYNNKGPVSNLNELEYINHKIYANVYGKNYLVIIDPDTGKVTGKIDCNNLLDKKDYHHNIDVLNGIAYNKRDNKIYITGKNWPKLFDIQIINKK